MIYSAEQLNIIYDNNENLLVEAAPGTGKTTVLSAISEEYNNNLYLVFSSFMRKSAENKFSSNTKVHTINSFALSFCKSNKLNFKSVLNELSLNQIEVASSKLNIFLNSSNDFFLKMNLFQELKQFFYEYCILDKTLNTEWTIIIEEIIDLIIKRKITPTQDFLLWYTEKNIKNLSYDLILIDEAQDLSPIMIKIINKIKGKKIYVGETKQSIFGFRDNVNFLKESNINNHKSLNKTYRFGIDIAKYINNFVEKNYKEEGYIIGNENINSKIVNDSLILSDYSAYISRTNALLFDKAFELSDKGLKVSIPYNMDEIERYIEDIYYLSLGLNKKVKNSQIKKYKNLDNLKKASKNKVLDPELSMLIKVFKKYNIKILDKLKQLKFSLASPSKSDVILITAHRAKGLQFNHVEQGSDFKSTSIEELNLQYVTLSRSILSLKPYIK